MTGKPPCKGAHKVWMTASVSPALSKRASLSLRGLVPAHVGLELQVIVSVVVVNATEVPTLGHRRPQSRHSRGVSKVASVLPLHCSSHPPCFEYDRRSEPSRHLSDQRKSVQEVSVIMLHFAHTNNNVSVAVLSTSASDHHQAASPASSSAGQHDQPSIVM
jgi:hypothetical protein